MTPIRLLYDRILVKPIPNAELTAGGLYIPDEAKEKPMRGEVIASGTGRIGRDGYVTPLAVQVGNKVLYGQYAGSEIKYEGQSYLVMTEADVLGIVE